MSSENTNWGQSVTGVVIKDNKVLLARHTYGNGKGMLIIPGGYVDVGETPQEALKREYREETNYRNSESTDRCGECWVNRRNCAECSAFVDLRQILWQ